MIGRKKEIMVGLTLYPNSGASRARLADNKMDLKSEDRNLPEEGGWGVWCGKRKWEEESGRGQRNL